MIIIKCVSTRQISMLLKIRTVGHWAPSYKSHGVGFGHLSLPVKGAHVSVLLNPKRLPLSVFSFGFPFGYSPYPCNISYEMSYPLLSSHSAIFIRISIISLFYTPYNNTQAIQALESREKNVLVIFVEIKRVGPGWIPISRSDFLVHNPRLCACV